MYKEVEIMPDGIINAERNSDEIIKMPGQSFRCFLLQERNQKTRKFCLFTVGLSCFLSHPKVVMKRVSQSVQLTS